VRVESIQWRLLSLYLAASFIHEAATTYLEWTQHSLVRNLLQLSLILGLATWAVMAWRKA